MSRLTTLWVICATLPLLAFNNCSAVSTPRPAGAIDDVASESPSGGGPNYNGGGYSGKLTFAHYGEAPVCAADAATPDAQIEISSGQIELIEKVRCDANPSGRPLAATELVRNGYDPYYLVHADRIYVNEVILAHRGPGKRASVHAFCYNPDYRDPVSGTVGIDFAVRLESTFISTGWQVRTIGHVIRGQGVGQEPIAAEMIGRLREDQSGSPGGVPFHSNDGRYILQFGPRDGAQVGPGLLTLAGTGERIPVDCHHLTVRGPTD